MASAVVLLTACGSVALQPVSSDELKQTTKTDRLAVQAEIEPLNGPLTLEEAIARVMKYNLERRVRQMEEAVASGQFDAGDYDLLPKLVASAGYRSRNNDLITRSTDSVTGEPSLSHPFISSDRAATTGDLSFTWSMLDFGQSYYASKQNADRVLVAAERRRKALHILIQDVRTAFWRTASAQKLKNEIRAAITEADAALADSRQAEAERLKNPLDALRYQRQLLENLRLLEAIDQELSTARVELASLTGLPLGQEIVVAEPAELPSTRWMEIPVEQMEEQAIAQNADLRESYYNARIARQETRRILLKLFPNLSFNYGLKVSNDSYLIHQNWNEAGAQLSFNFLGLLSAPALQRLGDAGVALADRKRMAAQMAVLTQVHLARQQYASAYRQFERADAIANVDLSIAEHTAKREQVQTQTKLDRVANQTSAILSKLRRYQALAQIHAAVSRLHATLGMEPAVEASQQMSVAELSVAVGKILKQWDEGLQQPATPTTPASPSSKN